MKLYNKFIGKKSQTAMEFLMTYGWAILIVLIVLAVLFAFGVFNPGTGQNTCRSDDSSVLCSDVLLDASDDEVRFGLRASGVSAFAYVAQTAMTVNEVFSPCTAYSATGSNDGDNDFNGNAVNMRTRAVTFKCDVAVAAGGPLVDDLTAGEDFSGTLLLTVTKVGGIPHTAT